MNLEQWLLLAAIAVTFVGWRRARRQSHAARTVATERLARLTYTLDAREEENGRGFAILDAAGAELDPARLSWEEHGLSVVTLHSAALELVPGAALRMEAAADGESVEVIMDESGAVSDVLRGVEAAAVLERLGDIGAAYVLRERRRGDLLPEVTILLIHRDVALDG